MPPPSLSVILTFVPSPTPPTPYPDSHILSNPHLTLLSLPFIPNLPSIRTSMSLPNLHAATLPRLLDPSLSHLRDITLVPARTPGRTLNAHRFVLAAVSPVLRASLAADPTAAILTLTHADYDALNAVLHFVYGKEELVARLKSPALWSALSLCIAYAILVPLETIQARIVDNVSVANVFYHWNMADKYSLDAVQLKCRAVIKENFFAVSRHPQFLNIDSHVLARVLRIHDLIVHSEDDIFQALERWLAFDVDARAENALNLLRLVRLPTISDRILLRVCRSPYFGGHNEFYQLLLEALIRRSEVRIVHAPRINAVLERVKGGQHPDFVSKLAFKPLGVTDTNVLPKAKLDQWPPTGAKPTVCEASQPRDKHSQNTDYNRKEDRTVLFEGSFPLRWYKSVRFRPRSPSSLLFTVIIPRWSSCRRRFISESRSFLNHKWSMWVDPFSADPTRSSRDFGRQDAIHDAHAHHYDRDHDPLYVGNTIEAAATSGTAASSRAAIRPVQDENDYISIYLCCESELSGSHKVEARVDFALFVASTTEEYGMERKVCVGRTFQSHGQAMGFRRHIRRSRLHSTEAGLYSRQKDELVVGAHLVAPNLERHFPGMGSLSLSRTSMTADDFRSESQLSPASDGLEGSRMTTMDTEPSPILT